MILMERAWSGSEPSSSEGKEEESRKKEESTWKVVPCLMANEEEEKNKVVSLNLSNYKKINYALMNSF